MAHAPQLSREVPMSPTGHFLPRRAVLKTVGAGLLTGLVTPSYAADAAEIWSAEYWARKGDVKLNLWRKRTGSPKPGEQPRAVLFLVHGSSNSSRSSYDLTVPGKGEYSMMNGRVHPAIVPTSRVAWK